VIRIPDKEKMDRAKRASPAQSPLLAATSFVVCVLAASLGLTGCDSTTTPDRGPFFSSDSLSAADLDAIVAHTVEQATRAGQAVVIAVTDRPGNILRLFRMTGAAEDDLPYDPAQPAAVPLMDEAVRKARTAAFLSSNQHGFTSLTACFITRNHFPPGLPNTPGGPLFGVASSNLPSSAVAVGRSGRVQPNGNGLTGAPGGVPLFKGGFLVGGLGVHGSDDGSSFQADLCGGGLDDERIALGGAIGYEVEASERGDAIFIDGIRFLFANADTPPGDFTFSYAEALTHGSAVDVTGGSLEIRVPDEGPIVLQSSGGPIDFSAVGGTALTLSDVQGIIGRASAQADRTRAAIRRPIGSAARVFICVVDVDGTVLGLYRTPEATLFSMDVSAQKARTALAFSQAGHALGQLIRSKLSLAPGAPLAVSTRAVGFLAQDFFPPGIDEEDLGHPIGPGPLFGLQETVSADPNLPPYGNGITIFPGGFPLYRGEEVVGAIGISGDGVDQDDLIGFAGTEGFRPPEGIRGDRFFFDGVRLPYVKFPRNPELE
jgi:uncharacterized protein GlcG (DUF336 family)